MNEKVTSFISKSKIWKDEMLSLRKILHETTLVEELKWGKPCYGIEESNIAIIQPFKNFLALMFFKGRLLKDSKKCLAPNGPNSQSAMRLQFQSLDEVLKSKSLIKAYIKEAIALEKSGARVPTKKKPEPLPAELSAVFKKKPNVKKAFESLTPGRQRAYILFFSGAKQSTTRHSRIEKCVPKILQGKGLQE